MRVYLDTNVLIAATASAAEEPEARRWSRALLRLGRRMVIRAVTSPLTLEEIESFDDRARRRVANRLVRSHRVALLPQERAPEAEDLAQVYIRRGAVPWKQVADARHLAWAVLAGADVFASWNRKHLVRLRTRQRVGIIHMERGLRPIGIELPPEVVREAQRK